MAKCWIKWTIHNWLKITSFKKNIITVWNTSGLDNQFNIKPSICSSLSWPFLYGFEPTKLRHVINSIYLFIKPSICLLSASNLHILISHFGRYFTIFFAVFFYFLATSCSIDSAAIASVLQPIGKFFDQFLNDGLTFFDMTCHVSMSYSATIDPIDPIDPINSQFMSVQFRSLDLARNFDLLG